MKSVSVQAIAFLLVLFEFESSYGFQNDVNIAKRYGPFKHWWNWLWQKNKLGEHECEYRTTKVLYKTKNVKSFQCHHVHLPCLNPNYPPFVRCSEVRCRWTKKSVPIRKFVRENKIVCCPGWKKNESSNSQDCDVDTCITLPQFTPTDCLKTRQANLRLKRGIYRFTTPPRNPPNSEITGENLIYFLKNPVLNLTRNEIAGLALRNPHEQGWARVYFAVNSLIQGITRKLLQNGTFNNLKTFTDYAAITAALQAGVNATALRRFCRYPSIEEDFKNIVADNVWQDDKVFTEQRLAGANPTSIRRLTVKEYMKRRPKFNPVLDKEIEKVSKKATNMMEMVKKGLVYILDYPALNNVTTMTDVTDLNSTDQREMKPSTSPVAIFVSLFDSFTGKRELKPLAIQIDFTAASPVLTPKDGLKWLLAKAVLQRADFQYVQIVEHLLKTHFLLGSICIAIQRQFSVQHPLYDILKYHCRGVLVTNGAALPALLYPDGALRKVLTIGNEGSIEMLNKAFPSVTWDDTNFVTALRKRGVIDASKLPYFPYRDDGIVLWKIVREFARELVDLFYHNTKFVLDDSELQRFANELSDKGTGPDGGKGMVKDFPNKIKSKWQLAETLARIIFIPVQHSAVNYPIAYYAGFVPNTPAKLYDDPRAGPDEFSIHSIPNGHVATIMAGLYVTLASLRYDNLFDYHPNLQDKKAAQLIEKYYKYLMGPVLKELKSRNERRLKNGHLTYPYFLPTWLPNSIHT